MLTGGIASHAYEIVEFALCLWREAAGEPYEGKVAVACVIMDRAKHPKWWGSTPHEVITKPKQFSSMTFPGDAMTIKWPKPDDPMLIQCIQIAEKAICNTLAHPAPGADHYYSVTLPAPPKWADESKFVKQIGHHRFYNLDGDPGE